jgi:hypothetical protein
MPFVANLPAPKSITGLGAANCCVALGRSDCHHLGWGEGTDLSALARQLADGELLQIRFRFNRSASEGNRVLLELKGSEENISPDRQGTTRNACRVAAMACPGFTPIPVSSPPITSMVRLPSPRRFLELNAKSKGLGRATQLGPRHFETAGGNHKDLFALAARGVIQLDIGRALAGLCAAVSCFELCIEVQAFAISTAERRVLDNSLQLLMPDMVMQFADPIRYALEIGDRALLQAWATSGRGWRVSAFLSHHPIERQEHSLQSLVADLLFGPERSQSTDYAGDPACDLSDACPAALGLPPLLPPAALLQRLGLASAAAKLAPARRTPKDLSIIGHEANGAPVSIPRDDLARHMLVIGASGSGKSRLLTHMVLEAINSEQGTVVICPHGDLVEDILERISPEARKSAIIADLSGRHPAFGIDLLSGIDGDRGQRASYAANQLISLFKRQIYADVPESTGPMYVAYALNALLLLLLAAEGTPRLADVDRIFQDPKFRSELLSRCPDETVVRFWKSTALRAGGEATLDNIAPYILAKNAAMNSPSLRPILSGDAPVIDFAEALDAGRLILVNLAKGTVGEAEAALMGALITSQIFGALMARCKRPASERRRVRIFADEAQIYATDILAQLLAEGRKTGAELTLCSQDLTSFGGSRVNTALVGAVLTNCSNMLVGRVGPRDAALLSDWFSPDLMPSELTRLPDRVFAARLMRHGVPQRPVLMRSPDVS